jgi:G:T/U-mismatch repair DNA glycosylase
MEPFTNTIPDLLVHNSPILFVGSNPATETNPTRTGHYFSAQQNQFFRLLNGSGMSFLAKKTW